MHNPTTTSIYSINSNIIVNNNIIIDAVSSTVVLQFRSSSLS